MQKNTIKRTVVFPAISMFVAASIWHGTVQAAESVTVLSYNKVVEAYQAHPKDAAEKYTKKRLAFRGKLMRMGSDPDGKYFGAMTDDGARFDTFFEVSDQAALKSKFKDQKIVAFQPSDSLVFECLNEGFLDKALVPSPRLTNCRLME